jgi:hypothetical protein
VIASLISSDNDQSKDATKSMPEHTERRMATLGGSISPAARECAAELSARVSDPRQSRTRRRGLAAGLDGSARAPQGFAGVGPCSEFIGW